MSAPEGFRSGFVSVVGRPNVGKSTLLNQILRAKVSITSDRPQTTRNAIRGIRTTDRGQLVFVDTPGFHRPRTVLGHRLNEVVRSTMEGVDAICFVMDAKSGVGRGDQFMARMLQPVESSVVAVLNKVDLVKPKAALLPQLDRAAALGQWRSFHPVSARTGEGVDELLDELAAMMPEGPMWYPSEVVSDQPEAVKVAELIREKALRLTREEVPHSIAVVVEEIERTKTGIHVSAIIYVERSSQKGIVLGKAGSMLTEIGTQARLDIQRLLGSRVHLHLRVKVEHDWQRRRELVERFGYGN